MALTRASIVGPPGCPCGLCRRFLDPLRLGRLVGNHGPPHNRLNEREGSKARERIVDADVDDEVLSVVADPRGEDVGGPLIAAREHASFLRLGEDTGVGARPVEDVADAVVHADGAAPHAAHAAVVALTDLRPKRAAALFVAAGVDDGGGRLCLADPVVRDPDALVVVRQRARGLRRHGEEGHRGV